MKERRRDAVGDLGKIGVMPSAQRETSGAHPREMLAASDGQPRLSATRGALLAFIVACAGCVGGTTLVVNGFTVNSHRWVDAREEVRRSVAFESGCSPYLLELTLLDAHRGRPLAIGAEGCGQRAVYRWNGRGWELDSRVDRAAAAELAPSSP